MSKDKISKEDKKILEELIGEITEEAKNVVEDYVKNPSEISGSVIQIHESSPFFNVSESLKREKK